MYSATLQLQPPLSDSSCALAGRAHRLQHNDPRVRFRARRTSRIHRERGDFGVRRLKIISSSAAVVRPSRRLRCGRDRREPERTGASAPSRRLRRGWKTIIDGAHGRLGDRGVHSATFYPFAAWGSWRLFGRALAGRVHRLRGRQRQYFVARNGSGAGAAAARTRVAECG